MVMRFGPSASELGIIAHVAITLTPSSPNPLLAHNSFKPLSCKPDPPKRVQSHWLAQFSWHWTLGWLSNHGFSKRPFGIGAFWLHCLTLPSCLTPNTNKNIFQASASCKFLGLVLLPCQTALQLPACFPPHMPQHLRRSSLCLPCAQHSRILAYFHFFLVPQSLRHSNIAVDQSCRPNGDFWRRIQILSLVVVVSSLVFCCMPQTLDHPYHEIRLNMV